MKQITTADRLKQILSNRGMRQVDILKLCDKYSEMYGVQIKKSDLSQYISGKVVPRQDKLSLLGMALGVNEVWLMGYDVPPGRNDLKKIEPSQSSSISLVDQLKERHGKDVAQAVSLFLQLDTLDRGRVIGNMEYMLQSDKYSLQEELRNA